jgi:hypothetical protein
MVWVGRAKDAFAQVNNPTTRLNINQHWRDVLMDIFLIAQLSGYQIESE